MEKELDKEGGRELKQGGCWQRKLRAERVLAEHVVTNPQKREECVEVKTR